MEAEMKMYETDVQAQLDAGRRTSLGMPRTLSDYALYILGLTVWFPMRAITGIAVYSLDPKHDFPSALGSSGLAIYCILFVVIGIYSGHTCNEVTNPKTRERENYYLSQHFLVRGFMHMSWGLLAIIFGVIASTVLAFADDSILGFVHWVSLLNGRH